MRRAKHNLDRRQFVELAGAVGAAGLAGCTSSGGGQVSSLKLGGVATIVPEEGWSNFEQQAGSQVQFSSLPNAPGELIPLFTNGNGRSTYDTFATPGSIEQPLAEQDTIQSPDFSRLDNYEQHYDFLTQSDASLRWTGYEGERYGVPIVANGDSMAYLPEQTGEVTSYEALYSDEFLGETALEDNWSNGIMKTARYLKENNLASIDSPVENLDKDDIRTTVDFLIERKEEGQFATLWTGFQTAVDLFANGEVTVADTWEPVVFELRNKGIEAEYAVPDEGYLLWGHVARMVTPPEGESRSEAKTQQLYDFLDWTLSGWYAANISLLRGYVTSPKAITYAEENFNQEDAQFVKDVHDRVIRKFEETGGWFASYWPDNRDTYIQEWQRFKNA